MTLWQQKGKLEPDIPKKKVTFESAKQNQRMISFNICRFEVTGKMATWLKNESRVYS